MENQALKILLTILLSFFTLQAMQNIQSPKMVEL